MINVTKTYLPPRGKLNALIDEIYANEWVTNNGPLVQRLESRLEEYLGVENLVLVANGTVALEIAYRALGIKGYAITTPFSFVATTSSLVTNGIKPIFCDIEPFSFNLDPSKIEELITPNTSAIVPVHVFGNPCDVESIERVATENDLKVIYDAAHAFGIKCKGNSILNYGDASTLSFHATKIFHSIEGGAIIFKRKEDAIKARYLINFGIKNKESIPELGTNAKMNEFEAAMGLCVLDDMDGIYSYRKEVYNTYKSKLEQHLRLQERCDESSNNYSYFPVVFESEELLLKVEARLNNENVFPRRYFYPSLDTLSYIEPKQVAVNSRDISSRILCLPIYKGISSSIVSKIIEIILGEM
ncbi:DegT/DnrJ/EryC1/StrS family aminotransferase [Vibrio atypicus]|uniref:DegT/DnrJ/EryC1/StrS family aminotransferase n=1 Tax=Vibrio atypicus TaxID=558271 RepID=UPI0037360C91